MHLLNTLQLSMCTPYPRVLVSWESTNQRAACMLENISVNSQTESGLRGLLVLSDRQGQLPTAVAEAGASPTAAHGARNCQ